MNSISDSSSATASDAVEGFASVAPLVGLLSMSCTVRSPSARLFCAGVKVKVREPWSTANVSVPEASRSPASVRTA